MTALIYTTRLLCGSRQWQQVGRIAEGGVEAVGRVVAVLRLS